MLDNQTRIKQLTLLAIAGNLNKKKRVFEKTNMFNYLSKLKFSLTSLNYLISKLDKKSLSQAEAILDICKFNYITPINYIESLYPCMLRYIEDPPLVIFTKGSFSDSNKNISIVGSRECSSYGKETAFRIASKLSSIGYSIVSGLARGIDSAAHLGAIHSSNRKDRNFKSSGIAILGSGILNIYPKNNCILAQEILRTKGCLISEYLPHEQAKSQNFPKRNRIISGLSTKTLIVEAKHNSGALITARLALDQGRDVYAIPGRINDETSKGTNYLIKQGAYTYTEIKDLL